MSNSQLNVNFYPKSRHEMLLVQEIKNETLVYDLTSNKAHCLNSTAAAVWTQCNGNNSLHQIVTLIKLQNNIETNEELVLLTIYELTKNKLLNESPEMNTALAQFDRRGMIRRLAIGTAFALPVISSLVAPTAIEAASAPISGACSSACVVGLVCACGTGHAPCPPGYLFNASVIVTAGICVTAAAEATINFATVGGGAQVNVCLIANACLVV
jgi:hypothetical protein